MNDVKPGWKTSEFWITILASGLTLAQQHQGQIPQPWGAIIIAVMTCAYTVARTITKA